MISSATSVDVFIDGRRLATIAADEFRQIQVSPGEHIVSTRVGASRQDRVVRVNADEQTVVRFPPAVVNVAPLSPAPPTAAATPVPPPPPPPPPSPTPSPTPIPTPVPTPAAVARATPLPPVPQAPQDEGVSRGAAANARGDFYRAVLILKDVTRQLEKSPQGKKELARAHAHLAWAYQGLNRPDDAQAAVDSALRADPAIVFALEAFPAQVVSLFKRAR